MAMKKNEIEFTGGLEFLSKLNKAGANLNDILIDAVKDSIKKPIEDMKTFIDRHKRTGRTSRSFVTITQDKGDKIKIESGFSVKGGGLPALFLDLGTPRIKPSFFIQKAIDNNLDEIKKDQEKALKKAFKELL